MKLPAAKRQGLRTWIEIDTQALRRNYATFRKVLGPAVKLMAVVKSNAYGHDLIEFAKAVERLGTDWLGVDSVTEGLALRRAGLKIPLFVLGYTLPENFKTAAENKITLTISTPAGLAQAKKYPALQFHLKIDTGMHRQGFQLAELAKLKSASKNLTGIYTHFAAAKNPAFPQVTTAQLRQFTEAVKIIGQNNPELTKHAAATGGTLLFPQAHLDLVRVGIGLYGLWPAKEVEAACFNKIKLEPVLSWRTIIGEVKTIPAGERVGYDLTEAPIGNKIAICPIGYWHGYPRALSGLGQVLVNSQRAKIIGRISMDMIILDVSHISKIKTGDVVTLLGADGAEKITADELGALAGTINYEIVTRLNPLMKRIYI